METEFARMPTIGNKDEDWLEYMKTIKKATDSLWMDKHLNRKVLRHRCWQLHRLAMAVMETGAWEKHPTVKAMLWYSLKWTAGFMDWLMHFEDICRTDKVNLKRDFCKCVEAKDKLEGRRWTISGVQVKKQKRGDEVAKETEREEEGEENEEEEESRATEEEDNEDVGRNREEEEDAIIGTDNDVEVEEELCSKKDESEVANFIEEDEEDSTDGKETNEEGKREDELEDFTTNNDANEKNEEEINEGLQCAEERGETYLICHSYKKEENLYNKLARYGRIVNINNEDGSEFKDPENLPNTVIVEFEKAGKGHSSKKRKRFDGGNPQWRIIDKNKFENVTEEKGRGRMRKRRWDVCDEESIFSSIANGQPVIVSMKRVVEHNDYYDSVSDTVFCGEKAERCEEGYFCMENVTELKELRIPGRIENSKKVHFQKCLESEAIKNILTK